MTTPRQHAELASKLHYLEGAISTLSQVNSLENEQNCLDALQDIYKELESLGIATAPPIKRAITLTVNGREWVLPEPLKELFHVGRTYYVVGANGRPSLRVWEHTDADKLCKGNLRMHATEAECQAWAEFDKWCRGGGV